MKTIICACGCGMKVKTRKTGSGRQKTYVNRAHKDMAWAAKEAGLKVRVVGRRK